MPRGGNIAKAFGLKIETAKTDQLGFGIIHHRLKHFARFIRAALKQGCLRIQQFNQRFLVGVKQLARLLGHGPCGTAITSTSGDDAGGK